MLQHPPAKSGLVLVLDNFAVVVKLVVDKGYWCFQSQCPPFSDWSSFQTGQRTIWKGGFQPVNDGKGSVRLSAIYLLIYWNIRSVTQSV